MITYCSQERGALTDDDGVVFGTADPEKWTVRPGSTKHIPKCGTYFIWMRGTHYVKIGKSSTSVEARLDALQTGSPHELVILAVMQITEKQGHLWFGDEHVRGEWFRLTDMMLELLSNGVGTGYRNVEEIRALVGNRIARTQQVYMCSCGRKGGDNEGCSYIKDNFGEVRDRPEVDPRLTIGEAVRGRA